MEKFTTPHFDQNVLKNLLLHLETHTKVEFPVKLKRYFSWPTNACVYEVKYVFYHVDFKVYYSRHVITITVYDAACRGGGVEWNNIDYIYHGDCSG